MYEIIFLDYSMPDLDGPEVSKELYRILEKERIAIPHICCCTAYSQNTFKDRAIAAGMHQFITKPVSFKELMTVCSILDWANKQTFLLRALFLLMMLPNQ